MLFEPGSLIGDRGLWLPLWGVVYIHEICPALRTHEDNKMSTLTIGHVDSELSWRGGQKQVVELIKGLTADHQNNILFCRQGSRI